MPTAKTRPGARSRTDLCTAAYRLRCLFPSPGPETPALSEFDAYTDVSAR